MFSTWRDSRGARDLGPQLTESFDPKNVTFKTRGPNRPFRCLDSDRCPNVLGNPEWPKNLSLQIVGRWQLAMLPRRFDVYLLHNTQFWCFWLGPEQNKIGSPTDEMILTKFDVIYHSWSFICIACCLMISLAFWQISLFTEFPQIDLDQKGWQKSL